VLKGPAGVIWRGDGSVRNQPLRSWDVRTNADSNQVPDDVDRGRVKSESLVVIFRCRNDKDIRECFGSLAGADRYCFTLDRSGNARAADRCALARRFKRRCPASMPVRRLRTFAEALGPCPGAAVTP